MSLMKVHFVSGISGDRVEVSIFKEDNTKPVFKESYAYGYNAAYCRDFANEKCLFIGDILRDLVETYYIGNGEIEYSGYLVFPQRDMREDEVQRLVDKILEEV